MNAPEFFVKHFGKKVWADVALTGDYIKDCRTMLRSSAWLSTGVQKRFSSAWAVITEDWTQTSFKVDDRAGIQSTMKHQDAVKAAMATGKPFLYLMLGMKSTVAEDLYLTYDPRALRVCGQGEVETVNTKEHKKWI